MKSIKMIAIKIAKAVLILLLLLFLTIAISAIVCNYYIKTSEYNVNLNGITYPCKLVVLADIHGKTYGNNNNVLFEKVSTQNPDAIILLGDIFPSHAKETDKEYVIELTRKIQGIAQVYFAMGNHESEYTEKYGDSWIDELIATGAVVFDESWKDLELCNNTIRIGGSLGHGYLYGRSHEQFEASSEYQVLSALEQSPYPAILLGHMPDVVALSNGPDLWHIDLVLSGHTHGGVIRIPGLGGLFAPMQGWWPRFDYGQYQLNEEMRMIITSGLSGHDFVPRIFNLPEICVINLVPD